MLPYLIQWGGFALAAVVCGLAIRRGGTVRAAGLMILIAWIATPLVADHADMTGVQWNVFAVDLTLWTALTVLYVLSPHRWLLIAAGIQLPVLLSHPSVMLDSSVMNFAYASMNWMLGYLQLIVIGLGATVWPGGPAPSPRVAPGAI